MIIYTGKRLLTLVLVGLPTLFIFFSCNTLPPDREVNAYNANDLVVQIPDGDMLLYTFENETFDVPGAGKRVGHNFYFTHFFPGNWTGNGTHDLMVRQENGDLRLYPYEMETFYLPDSGKTVGKGFNYTHYHSGNWTGNSTDDLIVRTSNAEMLLFPFENGTFDGPDAGKQVGTDWHYTHFFVGNWTGTDTHSTIIRKSNGDLYLYTFENKTFGSGGKVGENFNYTHYFTGDWTGNGTDDLIVRKANGDLHLFPFENQTFFVPGAGRKVGEGFNNYTHYFVGDWINNGSFDLIVRQANGVLYLYPFENQTFFVPGAGRKVGEGFNYSYYWVGRWNRDSITVLPMF